jgi:hypothetical protein
VGASVVRAGLRNRRRCGATHAVLRELFLLEACAVLERAVVRCGWELLTLVVLSNHLDLLVKTPRANLAKGMQAFLSGHAQWSGRRRRRSGHLFQGRH